MMKIAFTAPFPVEVLGSEVRLKNPTLCSHPASWIRSLAAKLVESGEIDLHIVTVSHNLEGDQIVARNGITFHLLSVNTPRWATWALHLGDSSSLWLEPLAKIHRTLAVIRPDIVHGHGTESYFSFAAVHSGYRNVISLQGLISKIYQEVPSWRYRIIRHFEVHTIRRAQSINAKTKMSESFVLSVAPNARIFFIEASINANFWSGPVPALGRNIFFVGPLLERKGIEEFVRGYVALKSEFADLKAYVIGDGSEEDREKYAAFAAPGGVGQDLIFTGQIDQDRIREIYRQGGIFCLTSHIENSPNVVMEAMAAGLPVVATDVGSVRNIVLNDSSGVLIDKGDVKGLVDAVRRILLDKLTFGSLGEKGREIASARWQPHIVARQHIEMYRFIIGDRDSNWAK